MISNARDNKTIQFKIPVTQFYMLCIAVESLYAANLETFSGNEIADLESLLDMLMPGKQECKTVAVKPVKLETAWA